MLFGNVLVKFWVSVMLASENELGYRPSFSVLWKHLYKIDVISSLKVWKNLLVKPLGPEVFFKGWF